MIEAASRNGRPDEPQRIPVAVIGSGAAGMMAALSAAKHAPVLLVTDRKLGRSNSLMAQGGLQVPPDSPEERAAMVRDMVTSGRGLSDEARIEAFVAAIPRAIAAVEAAGVEFDRTETGDLLRRLAGGLSRPRIISAKDQIGPRVMTALKKAVLDAGIPVLEFASVTGLVRVDDNGAPAFRLTLELHEETDAADAAGRTGYLIARRVVCAAGGRTFAHARSISEPTTNPANMNERIYATLSELGLTEENTGLYQYHPFGIVAPVQGRGKCVPETISNFAIAIRDTTGTAVCETGTDRLAMVEAMKTARREGRAAELEGDEWGLLMDIPEERREAIRAAFPKIAGLIAPGAQPLYVRPILHYYLGGFPVNPDYQSAVPGLYLAGEITTGLHGRNRLMGTGLLDSLVGGLLAGENAARAARVA